MTRDQLVLALREAVVAFTESGDASAILDAATLEHAQQLAELVIPVAGDRQRVDAEALFALGWLHWCRYQVLPEGQDARDLRACISFFSSLLPIAPGALPDPVRNHLLQAHDVPDAVVHAAASAIELARNYEASGRIDQLDAAIDLFRRTVDAIPPEHPGRAPYLHGLAAAFQTRFERTGQSDDLDAAIDAGRQAVATISTDDPERGRYLHDLASALLTRCRDRVGQPDDLDGAIDLFRQAVDATPTGHPNRVTMLSNLGAALQTRYEQSGQSGHLDAAIDVGWQAVDTAATDHPIRAAMLYNLGKALHCRYERTADPGDLDAAIDVGRQAVDTSFARDPNHATMLSQLGIALHSRHRRTGHPGDLDASIDLFRQAVDATPTGRPDRGGYLSNLGSALQTRYERTGQPGDLDAAIDVGRQAVDIVPTGHVDRPRCLYNLGGALHGRHRRTGGLDALDAAIDLYRQAVDALPAGHPSRTGYLCNLGIALHSRYQRTGHPGDLDEAIDLHRQVVEGTPVDDLERAGYLSNLGFALRHRYERTGQSGDLDAAIDAGRQAVAATPAGHPERAGYLSNLASALRHRYERTGQSGDLDAAIDAGRQAVDTIPADHPERAMILSNLGNALQTRCLATGQSSDVGTIIDLYRQAVAATPADHPDRAMYHSNLANVLNTRYERTGKPADLDAAIDAGRQAVAATPADHPNRAIYLSTLANVLNTRYERTRQRVDLGSGLDALREAAGLATATPAIRVAAARTWGRWAFEAGEYGVAADGYATAVELLPELAWHGLDRTTREEQLSKWAGLAADAAACAVAAGQLHRAVEMLEQGRSLLWIQSLHLRSDLTRLEQTAPDLADRLDRARAELDRPMPDTTVVPEHLGKATAARVADASLRAHQEQVLEQRRRAAREWDDALAAARRLEGFEYFLVPVPFPELQVAAGGGPVVIVNASDLGCHALIVTDLEPGIEVVELPDLTVDEAIARANTLIGVQCRARAGGAPFLQRQRDRHTVFDLLDWLWDTITGPVLDTLGLHRGPGTDHGWPRVWWCPTGPLTVLPLHAAGHHPRHSSQPDRPDETVSGRVISSYTPTLTALERARRVRSPGPDRQLAVGMPTTPGHEPLPAVELELAVLSTYFPEPEHARHLTAPNATRTAVLKAFPDHPWVHLACHGNQHPVDPSLSAFALQDGPLTIADLAGLRIDNGELAYLSACQTATGDTRLLDEAVHLAGAMQLIGYRHVIATLWTVADTPAPAIADTVYSDLTLAGHPDAARAAHALHLAVAALRRSCADQPLIWAPYIHIGA